MSFNYEKHKAESESGVQWTAYSDLFMGLATIFLLLYVTSSLKTGASNMQQALETQKLNQQVDELKQQLKVYNTLKQDYLDSEATPDDQKVYKDLMSKLSLLQDQAKDEKEALEKQADENAQKEQALNKYQQLVRNIVNANMVAQSRIKRRDTIIVKKDDVIVEKQAKISKLETSIEEKQRTIARGERKIKEINGELNKKMKDLQKAYENQMITKKMFQTESAKIRNEEEQKMSDLKSSNQVMNEQLAETKSKLSEVASELNGTKGKLESVNSELSGAKGELEHKSAEAKTLQGQLAKAQAAANATRELAKEIKRSFGKAGVKASVDESTGDVTLDFGDQYFDTGKADLKPEMRSVLEKAVPAYSKSLFENKKIASKIKSVEIVGFASPTYKGKYVNPETLSPDDRKAVDFNLDLSYARARSIFKHIFDTKRMTFEHQKELLPLVKVTGRSFLADIKTKREVAGSVNKKNFCAQFDCSKTQRVIIKFNLEN